LKERFLVVCGQLRTYKIHLGSGNILMESTTNTFASSRTESRIEPKRWKTSFLPFEGDSLLSVILSKAFLLADDSKIKDQSILGRLQVEADELLAMSEPKAYRIPIEPLRWEANDPLAAEHELVSRLVSETLKTGWQYYTELDLNLTDAGRKILAADPETAARIVLALVAPRGAFR